MIQPEEDKKLKAIAKDRADALIRSLGDRKEEVVILDGKDNQKPSSKACT